MKNDVFVTKIAKRAAASTMAGAFLIPQSHAVLAAPTQSSAEVVVASPTSVTTSSDTAETQVGNVFTYSFKQAPAEWTKELEKRFRKLALGEAKGSLTAEEAGELDYLNALRDRLLCPRTPDEILYQLKRDRVLEALSDTLKKYVEFQEGAGKKRPGS